MGTISADTDSGAEIHLNDGNCTAGENYKIARSEKYSWLTNITLTGNYSTLGTQTSSNLEKFQNLPVEYDFTLYFLSADANYAAFFANGLDRQEMPERIVARTYKSGKIRNDINIGKFTYNPNSLTSEIRLNRYIDEGFDRIDFIRIAANDSKNIELVASCSIPGVARADVGPSKYQEPAISVAEYAKKFEINQCTPASGWNKSPLPYSRGGYAYSKRYSLVDPNQQVSASVNMLVSQPVEISLAATRGGVKADFNLNYDFRKCPFDKSVKRVDLPERIKAVITLKDGQKKSQQTNPVWIEPLGNSGKCILDWYNINTPEFGVEWKNVEKYDFYRVSTSNPPVEELVASCVRWTPAASSFSPVVSPTPSASPKASPTQTASRSPQATKSPSLSPTPSPSPSPVASKTVAASDLRSPTPTPRRSPSPTPSPTPVRKSVSKSVWSSAKVVGFYLKSTWTTVSSWFGF
jgi:hypothetical protein